VNYFSFFFTFRPVRKLTTFAWEWEIANIEAMKMENAVVAPFDGQIEEICVKLNDIVREGQILFILKKIAHK